MTDGWNARSTPPRALGQPVPPPFSSAPSGGQSPWWSDAMADPWRDPYAPAHVMLPPPVSGAGPEPEPVTDPDAPRRSLAPVLLICVITALLAGGLGGTLGFLFAARGGYRRLSRPARWPRP